MAELNCTLEPDFSFIQKDCHWELNRYFLLTWNQADGNLIYYRLGEHADDFIGYKSIDTSKIYTKGTYNIYEIPLSSFDAAELASARSNDGWLTITICKPDGIDYKTFTKFYYLELPPVYTVSNPANIVIDYVYETPGKFSCTWNPAVIKNDSIDDVDGYCIELFHCPRDLDPTVTANFTQVLELTWDSAELENGKYKLVKDTPSSAVELPKDGEGNIITDVVSYSGIGANSEVYIESADKTQFYFIPKELGIKPGDSYKFVIYPYSYYGVFQEEVISGQTPVTEHSSFLASQGSESNIMKLPKGVVRAMTLNGWVEGQVWVFADTADGPKWVEAEAIYAMADDGNGKGVWKEAQ
jgi:hypothetical protein